MSAPVSEIFDATAWTEVAGFDFADITYHRANDVGAVRIAFDRPEIRNAFRPNTVDELYTAPDAGQPSAEAYYAWASAGPVLGRIRVPTLVLSASDDPMVPVSMFEPWRDAASVRFVHPRTGGHVGYVGRGRPR